MTDSRDPRYRTQNDPRFSFPLPNADSFNNPPPGTDRFPVRDTHMKMPPPRNNDGSDGLGAPPRRDRRRSRAQGQNIAARIIPGQFDMTRPTRSAQIAAWDTGADEDGEEASTVIVMLKTYDFSENAVTAIGSTPVANPFGGVISSILPENVFQSLEVIANLQWGHDGVSQKVVANMPAGQIVRGNTAGTYCRANALLTPRYFERIQDPDIAGNHFYHYLALDPGQRNNIFNSANSPALDPEKGFDEGTVPTTPIHIEGIISIGYPAIAQGGSFDRSSRLTRRFFGTVPPEVGPYPTGGAVVSCPIAFGASAVMLQANPTDFTNFAGNVLSPLFFGMIDSSGTIIVGQLPPNTFFPLTAECQSIFVYNTDANGAENPFSLIYDLGL
jgi:hypothetical protein